MARSAAFLAVTALTVVQAAASENSPAGGERLVLGLRVGVAVPSGDLTGGPERVSIAELTPAAVPIGIEVGYRLGARWTVVGLAETSIPVSSKLLEARWETRVSRAVLAARWQVGLEGGLRPWLGAGVGHEQLQVALHSPAGDEQPQEAKLTCSGWLAVLQAGVAFRLAPRLLLGPFTDLSVGRYGRLYEDEYGQQYQTMSGDPRARPHWWWQVGLLMTFEP